MLVLTRKVGEAFLIDGGIRIVVLKDSGTNSLSLGIEAPPNVNIVREELLEQEVTELLSELPPTEEKPRRYAGGRRGLRKTA